MRITSCKVNHLTDPLGFSMEKCVFSWAVEDAVGKKQTAARIVVQAEDQTVADTGWTNLDSLATRVDVDLKPCTRYFWKVSARTDAGEEATSDSNWFETGVDHWDAKWIGCDDAQPRHPVFSKEITPAKQVRSARLYICGLGLYEASWNGEKIGGEYLTPYCNNYNRWVQYQTYDVTAQLQNAGKLSVELGNGWYKGRFAFDRDMKPYYGDSWKLMAQVRVVYTDGTWEVIGTDESWQVTRSNICFSNIYDGEQRDDTLPEMAAVGAVLVDAPQGKLTARYSTPVTVQQERSVQQIIHTPAGETVIDVGQNMTGSFRLAVHEPAGTKIHLQFGEILQNGNFYRDNLRTAKAEYIYISDGKPHVLEPKFTFYGYRYVKVSGVTQLNAGDFTGLVLHSQLPPAGKLETGNQLVNQLIRNVEWGQIGNFLDVPTDCPQRDERMGWTGDAQVFAPTACYQRDSYAFLAKYLYDIWTEQLDNHGAVPDVVPSFGKKNCAAAWGDAACIIPWTLYEFYGDRTILEQQYPSMRAWVDHIRTVDGDDNGWRRQYHYGDWLALADRILCEIRREYFTPSGRCAVPTQTGLLLSVRYGLSSDKDRAGNDLANRMVRDGNSLKTGFVGTPLLCPELTRTGHEDIAFDLLLNEGYPGWLYAVKLGATTIWERWNSVDEQGVIADNGMNSLNHYAYGSIAQWLYQDVAGIAPEEPGFRKARLAPHMNARLGKMTATYASAVGKWEVSWEVLANGDVYYRCRVPFNCRAVLILPYGGGTYQLEAGVFEKTYTPNIPLRIVYSSRMPIRELLQVPRVKAALVRITPLIGHIPSHMQKMSMRELAAKMGAEMTDEMFDGIDAMLATL